MQNLNNLTHVGTEILIADASVDQLDVLLSGLRPSVQIRLLNPHDDVISLLVQTISCSNLDTLHLLGHGAPGEIILGGKVINLSSLDEIKKGLLTMKSNINNSMDFSQAESSEQLDTQICLWSCRTGAESAGKEFIHALANITNSTIFATEQLVGHQSKGGTWNLEQIASPRRGNPFSDQARDEFDSVLANSVQATNFQVLNKGTASQKVTFDLHLLLDPNTALTSGSLDFVVMGLPAGLTAAALTTSNLNSSTFNNLNVLLPYGVSEGYSTDASNANGLLLTANWYANAVKAISGDKLVASLSIDVGNVSLGAISVMPSPTGSFELSTDANVLEVSFIASSFDPNVLPIVLDVEATGTLNISAAAVDQGQAVTASLNVVDADGPTTTSYQWQVQGPDNTWTNIAGAINPTLTPDQALAGKTVQVVATSHDPKGGETVFTGTPVVINDIEIEASGTLTTEVNIVSAGNTVTANLDNVFDADGATTTTYQWQVQGEGNTWTNIAGAVNPSFTPIQAFAGKTVQVVATSLDAMGGTTSFTSDSISVADVDANGQSVNLSAAPVENGIGYKIINSGSSTSITGSAGNDTINGGSGNDTINGGAGVDAMAGGAGNDTYVVDNAGDTVSENSNAGNDSVQSSVSFTTPDNVENITLTGVGNIDATGNEQNNTITGNTGDNRLEGAGGNDTLIGGGGDDTISGGSGNDTFEVNEGGNATITDLGLGVDVLEVNLDASASVSMAGDFNATNLTSNDGNVTIDTNGHNIDLSNATGSQGYTINGMASGGAAIIFYNDTQGQNELWRDSGAGNYGAPVNDAASSARLISGQATLWQHGIGQGDHVDLTAPGLYNLQAMNFDNTMSSYVLSGQYTPISITGSRFDDTITATGTGETAINAGDGQNTVSVTGAGSVTITSGAYNSIDDSAISVTNAADTTIAMSGAGDDHITTSNTGNTNINAADGQNIINVSNAGNVNVSAANYYGNVNEIAVSNVQSATINTGMGDDRIVINDAQQVTINAGEGDDQISIYNSGESQTLATVQIDGGSGIDTLALSGDIASYQVSTGADKSFNMISADVGNINVSNLEILHFNNGQTVATPVEINGLTRVVTSTDLVGSQVIGSMLGVAGSINDWTIAPAFNFEANPGEEVVSDQGYKLTHKSDSNLVVSVASSVGGVQFADGGEIQLGKGDAYGTVTLISGELISVTAGSVSDINIVLGNEQSQSVQGAADSDSFEGQEFINIRSDQVTLDVNRNDVAFSSNANDVLVHYNNSGVVKTLSEVESVHFRDGTVNLVGANGYASINEATTPLDSETGSNAYHANSGEEIFVTAAAVRPVDQVGIDDVTITVDSAYTGNAPRIDLLSDVHTLHLGGDVNVNVLGSAAANVIYGNSGNNTITGNGGSDTIYGGSGNDTISASFGDVHLDGGSGNDTISASFGDVHLDGGSGNDTITTDSTGYTFINAGEGNNIIDITDAGDVDVYASSGNDQITSDGTGSIYIDAGEGQNIIDVKDAFDTTINTGSGDDNVAVDGFFRNNNITVGSGNNTVNLRNSDGNGNVYVNAGDGNDEINAFGNGRYIINAGAGENQISVDNAGYGAFVTTESGNDDITVTHSGSSGINSGDGDDHISVDGGYEVTINAGDGNDVISASGYNLNINAGDGDDVINLELTNSSASRIINGGAGDDLLVYHSTSSNSNALNNALSRLAFVNNTDGSHFVQIDGKDQLSNIERIQFENNGHTVEVRIVGQGCYASIAAATAQQDIAQGTIVYVTDTGLITGDTVNHSGLNIYFEQSNSLANLTLANDVHSVDLYGQRNFTLTGTAANDVIHDHTVAITGVNTINGMAGNDILISDSNAASITVLNGGEGDDVLSGGFRDQLFGGNGNDTLLAAFGNAYLSGGSGNDLLINAYLGTSSDQAVTMLGGSGNDSFVLMGSDNNSLSGMSNTIVGDLATGDKIDLSFLEKSNGNAFSSTADLSGKASLTGAGATFNLSGFNLSSSEGGNDVDHLLTNGSQLVVANSTLSKASTAITAGFSAVTLDLSAQFGHLSDIYTHAA